MSSAEFSGESKRRHGGLLEGLAYVARRRALAVVVGGFALVTLGTGLVNATLPKFTSGLGLGAGVKRLNERWHGVDDLLRRFTATLRSARLSSSPNRLKRPSVDTVMLR